LGALPRSLYGHGSAILNTLQQLAAALGTAVFIALLTLGAAVATASGASAQVAQASGASWAFAVGGVITTAAVVRASKLRANRVEVDAAVCTALPVHCRALPTFRDHHFSAVCVR